MKKEDMAVTNSVGAGNIAGVPPEETIPVRKKKKDETIMLKRFKEFVEDHYKDELEDGEEVLDEKCTKGEKKMKKNMEKEYGKKKGEKIFFATKNKHKKE